MKFALKPLAALLPLAFVLPVAAQGGASQLDTIVVSADGYTTPVNEATYASEVHTRKDIEASGASSLYDYLANHSSLQVLPSYGNRMTPKLDMRGYGIGDGYQNIVVSLDGRRLNNIDMSPQLIGGIPLSEVERIEISKGSGSVLLGDGAMAGSVQIHTRKNSGVAARLTSGSNGYLGTTANAGFGNEFFHLRGSYDRQQDDGPSKSDVTGHKAASDSETLRMSASGKLGDRLSVSLDGQSTKIDTRYVGHMTLAEFKDNPAQNSGNTYTRQRFSSDTVRAAADLEVMRGLRLHVSRGVEDKLSHFILSGWKSEYEYEYISDEIHGNFENEQVSLRVGYQGFDGVRQNSTNKTYKDNRAWFISGQTFHGPLTLSAGLRREAVEYRYRPNAGAPLSQDEQLHGWDLGANYRLDETTSLFANLNRAYQAPDIDRFFSGGTFNQFIAPARAHTLNLGLHHLTARNRFQATLFGSRLKNEIYYYSTGNWLTSYNTNLDKSRKYGLELQDTVKVTDRLTLSGKYAYTRAIIDEEADGGGTYNGKDLPGVPRHSVNLGAQWRVGERTRINLSQVWRSEAYSADDFANTRQQKQRAYASTDVSLNYRYGKVDFFAGVENLFNRANGIWVRDDRIYPVNFERSWKLGVQANF